MLGPGRIAATFSRGVWEASIQVPSRRSGGLGSLLFAACCALVSMALGRAGFSFLEGSAEHPPPPQREFLMCRVTHGESQTTQNESCKCGDSCFCKMQKQARGNFTLGFTQHRIRITLDILSCHLCLARVFSIHH